MWDISLLFHEKQEGRLCAQHCLNAALQGSYFTAVDLGELAMRLDEEERQQMSESEKGVESEDYKRFLEQPSGNMDDTGFFSVQVISKALSLWNLDLTPLNSTDSMAITIKNDPIQAQAFIFNMENHWFCIRRFECDPKNEPSPKESVAFFNLDSLLSRPEYMSSSFLTEYIKQMQNEGYSVFIVSGEFPQCSAEPLSYVPNNQPQSISFIDLTKSDSKASVSENDEEFQRAIQISMTDWQSKTDKYLPVESVPSTSTINVGIGSNQDLEAALKLSLECFSGKGKELSDQQTTEPLTPNQLRDRRLAYFNLMSSQNDNNKEKSGDD